eukprot:COSAG06_NODE_26383_length_616_cov_0.895551_1_plen_156_part_10
MDEVLPAGASTDEAQLRHGIAVLQGKGQSPAAEQTEPVDPELARWLDEVRLGQYKGPMGAQGYDFEMIKTLTDDEAAEVIASVTPEGSGGDRLRFKKAVKKLRATEATTAAPLTAGWADSTPGGMTPEQTATMMRLMNENARQKQQQQQQQQQQPA